MKNLMLVGAVLMLVSGLVSSASAGESAGSVSQTAMASLGFGHVHVMSDTEGMAVRGKGFNSIDHQFGNGYGSNNYGRNTCQTSCHGNCQQSCHASCCRTACTPCCHK